MLVKSIQKPLYKTGQGTMTKEYININGSKQGLIIESLNNNRPLLLFLHGGPGFPVYPVLKGSGVQLENHFDVCYWDQKGTGMSYDKNSIDTPLSVEQLVEDTLEVTRYLLNKFNKDKIFLAGHSWGTFLGALSVYKQPELYHSYIGIGQINSFKASEKESYDFMLNMAKSENDTRAYKQIENVQFDDKFYKNRHYGQIKSKYINKYGGGFKRDGYSSMATLKDLLMCKNYTLKESINILAGSMYSYNSLSEVLANNVLIDLVPALEVPVFILHGIHDYQTTYSEGKSFYDLIDAPYKNLYTFNHSAHAPFLDEPDEFYRVLEEIKNKVLD